MDKMTEEGKKARAEYMREWRKANPEKEMQREKYMREYMREYMRQWRKANPDKVRDTNTKYWNKRAQRTSQEAN